MFHSLFYALKKKMLWNYEHSPINLSCLNSWKISQHEQWTHTKMGHSFIWFGTSWSETIVHMKCVLCAPFSRQKGLVVGCFKQFSSLICRFWVKIISLSHYFRGLHILNAKNTNDATNWRELRNSFDLFCAIKTFLFLASNWNAFGFGVFENYALAYTMETTISWSKNGFSVLHVQFLWMKMQLCMKGTCSWIMKMEC